MGSGTGYTQEITIERGDLLSGTATQLINALNNELSERYPEEGANHFQLDAEEVREGRGGFFIVFSHSEPIGCGAVRKIDDDTAEIKRMYIVPHARNMGLGRRILQTLEAEASRLGVSRMVLETGERQPEALSLYTRLGFVRIQPFGEYIDSPFSVCMGKAL